MDFFLILKLIFIIFIEKYNMNHKNDIKVTFLNDVNRGIPEKIRVFFKDIFNNDIQIDLRQGEVVYSQSSHLSNSLKIYSKKGIIKVEEKKKPNFLKYYIGYKLHEIEDRLFLSGLQESLSPEPKKTTEEEPKVKKESLKRKVVAKPKKVEEINSIESLSDETVVEKAIKEIKEYSKIDKPKAKSKKSPGRPKKRGPKKGSKNKKAEE